MDERDALSRLSAVADTSEHPTADFEARLLDDLLEQLDQTETDTGPADAGSSVVHIMENGTDMNSPKRPAVFVIVAAAAALVAVIAGVWVVASDSDDDRIETDTNQITVTPATTTPPSTAPATTAPAISGTPLVVDVDGGLDVPVIAEIVETNEWNSVTFDPADPTRVMTADMDYNNPVSPELWRLGDTPTTEPIPDVEARSPSSSRGVPGGRFQRDGTMLFLPEVATSSIIYLADNAGEPTAAVRTENYPAPYAVSEGESVLSISTAGGNTCPYLTINAATVDGITILDETENGFSRVAIAQPGVAVALPYFPDEPRCDPNASTVARVWDLSMGQPLADHPFDGEPIARVAVSGDQARGVIVDGDGAVSVIAMDSGETIADLGTVDAGLVFEPLAINDDGTIVATAENDGRLTLWSVETGEPILTVTSGTRETIFGYVVSASLAYDASRAALLDAETGSWQIISLDPADWVAAACDTGETPTPDELSAVGLDPSSTC
ncbi:MAG: hypothetical protein AAGA42_11055 [Actinomycetota bacterium]